MSHQNIGLVIDPIHHRTGITQSRWNYSILQENITAIEFLIANQFWFYQFHANMFVAILFSTVREITVA